MLCQGICLLHDFFIVSGPELQRILREQLNKDGHIPEKINRFLSRCFELTGILVKIKI